MSAADWASGGPWRAGDDGPADRDRPDDYEPPSRRRTLAEMVPDGLAVTPDCEVGTGWMYCAHADDSLTPCDCSCKCIDQRHCPRKATR